MAVRLYDDQDDGYDISRLIAGEDLEPHPFETPFETREPEPPAPPPVSTGYWTENYEWRPGEGGPKVSDLLSEVGDTSRLSGWNVAGWGTGARGTESEKNAIGMIMTQIDPTRADAIDQLLAHPRVKQFWPNAVRVGRDQIDLDGPGPRAPVDVIAQYGAAPGGGGTHWTYNPVGMGAPPTPPGSAPGLTPRGPRGGIDPKNLIHPLTGEPISEAAYRRLADAGYVDPITGRPKPYRVRSRVRDLLVEPGGLYTDEVRTELI